MKFFFIVQGEGMGHTTQSLALRKMLEKSGHSVESTFLGTNLFKPRKKLYQSIRHKRFMSPVFMSRQDKTGINLFLTFIFNFLLCPVYVLTILRIAYKVRTSEAHAVIVFYDMVGQLGTFLSFTQKPVFSISHHFFFNHPAFKMPDNRKTEQLLLKIHTWLASLGAKKILALSFTKEVSIPEEKLFIIPPLLREEILNASAVAGDHVHIYSLQQGFLNSILMLAEEYPQKEFRVFLHEMPMDIKRVSNIHIYPISGDLFLESLCSAGMVICTSGFESPAEAVYLNKNLIVVPSTGHFEQFCNALDILRAGAARTAENFHDIEIAVAKENPAHAKFYSWVQNAEGIILKLITE